MQVVCGNCQLNFQAPDGATGLVCPICRSPLRPAQSSPEAASNKNILEWDGGTLDDLMAILTAPALAVRVEVIAASNDNPVGEVHLLAGGVSEAIYNGKADNDALDNLRSVMPARFRIEPRLPNPTDGDLTYPGPDSGTLDARPLAHLMRYCEQYVITAAIEVWRGNENARVDYRKGEISGVTVGGIDAPERLAEVMRWSSGNYRLVVPRLTLPEVVPVAAAKPAPAPAPAPAVVPAPAPAAAAARQPAPAAATRTIFGMPALDEATMRAVEAATAAATAASPAAPAAAAPAEAPVPQAAPPAAREPSTAATRTIFGVPAPIIQPPAAAAPPAAASAAADSAARDTASRPAAQTKQERKRGARKTAVPRPEIIPPSPDMAAAAPSPAATLPMSATAAPAAAPAATAVAATTTAPGTSAPRRDTGAPEVVLTRPPIDEKTSRVVQRRPPRREAPIWTYVGVGFTFGLVLLGIYRLVGALAH